MYNHLRRLATASVALFGMLHSAEGQAKGKLLDTTFAKAMCKGWNATSLPKELGRGGSGWIDSADSEGSQALVIGRRDCDGHPLVKLVIEADANGDAMCASAGRYTKGGPMQWKFEPTTEQWADFTDGFGVMKMPGIMSGFVGPYTTAMNNIGSFEVFFAMAGHLALGRDVDWQCKGADMEEVTDEIGDIDKGDMKSILEGMAVLTKKP